MRIEAVTVCVGYADFLAHTAEWNRGLFDRWVVVTSPEDNDTRTVCHRYSIDTVLSREHKRDGEFAKGRLIEMGQRQLSAKSWHLHLDADIVLPSIFRNVLESAWLNEDKVYGCDRILCRNFEHWCELKKSGWLQNQGTYHNVTQFPKGYEIGSRWVSPRTGYVPIGFFQLAHQTATEWRGTRQRPYPVLHGDACRNDVQYGLQWDRRDREMLPELIVAHLESEQAPLGANWNGRKTKPFGPRPNWMPNPNRPQPNSNQGAKYE